MNVSKKLKINLSNYVLRRKDNRHFDEEDSVYNWVNRHKEEERDRLDERF